MFTRRIKTKTKCGVNDTDKDTMRAQLAYEGFYFQIVPFQTMDTDLDETRRKVIARYFADCGSRNAFQTLDAAEHFMCRMALPFARIRMRRR